MEREINITVRDANGKEFVFNSFSQLVDFCNTELEFWANTNQKLPENISINQQYTKINHLQALSQTFESWREIESSWSPEEFNSNFNQIQNQHISQLGGDWIWSGHAFVPVWVDLHEMSQATADSFISTILNRQPNTISNSVDHMKGHILAYEFLLQDESELTKRRNAERKSLASLRSQLTKKNEELIEDVEKFQGNFSKWDETTRETSERSYQVRKKLNERQIKNQKRRFSRELKSWQERIKNLEDTYAELLRLKKPAEYWNKSATKYGRQGVLFSLLIAFFVICGLNYFQSFFVAWLQGQPLDINLSTLQGVVIFASAVALFAFLLKVLSRLAFSSFHLMRDAEEREQLTYLYLSLSENTSVEDESRNIILQALFSRSETGLLAQDHGPTMPSAGEAVKFATGSK